MLKFLPPTTYHRIVGFGLAQSKLQYACYWVSTLVAAQQG